MLNKIQKQQEFNLLTFDIRFPHFTFFDFLL